MFVFGHVGLTWGGALLLVEASRRLSGPSTPDSGARWRAAGPWIDYRLLIAGSMLPDLIDKPLGVFILRDELSSGLFFAHSLLFVLAIALLALAWQRQAGRLLGSLSLGSAAHLVFDRMWRQTDALFWPLSGWRPERQHVSGWLGDRLDQLFSDPYVYVSEAMGALVVLALLLYLLTRRALPEFVRSGVMRLPVARPAQAGLAAGEERPHQMEGRERPAQR